MCEATEDAQESFEKSLTAPALARDFVEQRACSEHGTRSTVALQLLASELVTNAVLYGTPPISVQISCDGYTMRVEVHDGGRSSVSGDTDADPVAADGLGLLLVDKIAHEWGVLAEGPGRTFWGAIRTGLVPGQTPRPWPEAVVRSEAASSAATAPH